MLPPQRTSPHLSRLSRLSPRAAIGALSALMFLGACRSGSEGNEKATGFPAPAPGEIAVRAELVDIAGLFPDQGLYDYVYVMRYRVRAVEAGNLSLPSDSSLLVAHANPRVPRNEIRLPSGPPVAGGLRSFGVGNSHRLVLLPLDSLWSGTVIDEYYRDTALRYFAVRADGM